MACACAEMTGQILEYLLAVVLLALCVAVPLYAKDGYHQIGNAKFEIYRKIMTGGFSVLSVLAVIHYGCRCAAFVRRDRLPAAGSGRTVRGGLSVTDLLVCAYLGLTGISVLSGGFYEDALWGSFGWNMGFLSQLSFVLLYLFVSRFGKYYRAVLAGLCATAAVVFGIGILHRLMIDPVGFYEGLTDGQKAQFLSTLGQATWYASFLIVTLPVGMGLFLCAAHGRWRAAGAAYTMLGFCTLVTQNSDSAYFALAGMMLVFFMVCCERREALCRFMAVCAMFFAAGKIMGFLMRIRPNPKLEPDFVTELMWSSGLTWVCLAACLAAALLLRFSPRKRTGDMRDGQAEEPYPAVAVRWMRRGAVGIVAAAVVAAVGILYLQAHGRLPAVLADRAAEISYLNWGDEWGNGRGRIWTFVCRVLSEENWLHRIFGVGPDCFNSYMKACHGEEVTLLWGHKQLTNAHNEWLNMLVNGGILGAASYLGIFGTAACRFWRGRERNHLLAGLTATIVSYMCYNFFCYQQVLCTPFLFLLMGIGEYILRNEEGHTEIIENIEKEHKERINIRRR